MSNPFAKHTLAWVEEQNRKVEAGRLKKLALTTPAIVAATVADVAMKKRTANLERRPEKLENEIQQEIEDWLMTQVHQCWWDRKRMDRPTTSRVGVPDFVGSWRGRAFGLEVKKPGGKPSTEQQGELAWMRKAGAVVGVVFSKEEAVEFFMKIEPKS